MYIVHVSVSEHVLRFNGTSEQSKVTLVNHYNAPESAHHVKRFKVKIELLLHSKAKTLLQLKERTVNPTVSPLLHLL